MRVPPPAPAALLAALLLGSPRHAVAGMPTVMLTDIARARIQVISFFLVVLLLCAWAVKGIWNSLANDVPRLPRLSFGKACGLVTLWGLLFLLVLTMISGARELLTPGAWEKVGLTSRLVEPPEPEVAPLPDPRQVKIEKLRAALWAYARNHEGNLPPDDSATEDVPDDAWQTPASPLIRYAYVPGRHAGDVSNRILAYEPGQLRQMRYFLRESGEVGVMILDEIRKSVDAKGGVR